MTRLARALVAGLVAAAVLSPVAGQVSPRGFLPAPTADRAAAASWGASMSRSEPRRPARPEACNQGRARWTRAEVVCAIRRVFPADPSTALCIAWRESRLDPHATGRLGERGLFQLHPVHRAWLGARRWARMYEPVANARAARDLVRRAGWSPWSTAPGCL